MASLLFKMEYTIHSQQRGDEGRLEERLCAGLTWRPSFLQRPLLVFVGAIVTTGGVFGTL